MIKPNDKLIPIVSCKKTVKKNIITVIRCFFVYLILAVCVSVELIKEKMFYLFPGVVLFGIIIVYVLLVFSLLPHDSVLYDSSDESLHIYLSGTIFTWLKEKVIKLSDVTDIRLNVAEGKWCFEVRTINKFYRILFVDDPEDAYRKLYPVLPDVFFVEKYIDECNFDKINTFADGIYFDAMYEIFYKANFQNNLKQDDFNAFIYLYFLKNIECGDAGLNYFILYFHRYLKNVIDMFEMLNLPDAAGTVSRLYFIIPQGQDDEYFAEYANKISSEDKVSAYKEQLFSVINLLKEENKDLVFIKRFREYYQGKRLTDFKSKLEESQYVVYSCGKDKILISYQGRSQDLEIPDYVTKINHHAFGNCYFIKTILIPGSITSIEEGAFRGCSSLTINCEADKKPSGWDKDWNVDKRPVNWGYKK